MRFSRPGREDSADSHTRRPRFSGNRRRDPPTEHPQRLRPKTHRRGSGPRGDLSDDYPEESLDEPILDWPIEPSLDERPLQFVRDGAGNPEDWVEVVGDQKLRSWMFVKYGHGAIAKGDLETLIHDTEWQELSGGTGKTTRKTAWMVSGQCRCTYRYGKAEVEPTVMPDWFNDMRCRWLQDVCTTERGLPDCVNLNLYEHGMHGVGWHADDEVIFGGRYRDCAIISVSLGDSRRFRVGLNRGRHNHRLIVDRDTLQDVELGHGDVCTMEGLFQKHYIHALSRCRKDRVGPRVNATFRWIDRHCPGCPLRPSRPSAPLSLPHEARRRFRQQDPVASRSRRERNPDDQGSTAADVCNDGDNVQGAFTFYDRERGEFTKWGIALAWVVGLCVWTATFLL